MRSFIPAPRLCVYIVLTGLMSMALTGCGVKPSSLSQPAGTENSGYPHTYPDPATDQE